MKHGKVVFLTGVGRNVGKTLLGERLTTLLSSSGLEVCVIKHVHHGVDYRVKDTGRYLAAGAKRVYAIGPNELMIVEKSSVDPVRAITELISTCDVVIVEGFRSLASRVKDALRESVFVVCIGFSSDYCDYTLATGFDAGRAAEDIARRARLRATSIT